MVVVGRFLRADHVVGCDDCDAVLAEHGGLHVAPYLDPSLQVERDDHVGGGEWLLVDRHPADIIEHHQPTLVDELGLVRDGMISVEVCHIFLHFRLQSNDLFRRNARIAEV